MLKKSVVVVSLFVCLAVMAVAGKNNEVVRLKIIPDAKSMRTVLQSGVKPVLNYSDIGLTVTVDRPVNLKFAAIGYIADGDSIFLTSDEVDWVSDDNALKKSDMGFKAEKNGSHSIIGNYGKCFDTVIYILTE